MRFTRPLPPFFALSIAALACTFCACGAAPGYAQTSQSAMPASYPPVDTQAGISPAAPLTPDQQREMQSEIALGRQTADQIAKTEVFVTDPAIINRVQTIGARLAAVADTTRVNWKGVFGNSDVYPFHYTYHVIKSKEVNAFSLPGGFIYIYQGLYDLLTTDDELAAVLGHETAHAAHHHIPTLLHQQSAMNTQFLLGTLAAVLAHVPVQDIANLATGTQLVQEATLNNGFSEHAEEDADHTGMIYAMKAGYNPVGMYAMLMRLKQEEDRSPDVDLGYLRDHPLTSARVAAAKAELASLGYPVTPHALRETEGTMLATLASEGPPSAPTATDICIGGLPVARLVPEEHDEALAAIQQLNQLLDDNLQLYEVKSQGPIVLARDYPVITFSDADAALVKRPNPSAPPPTPSSLADSTAAAIRTALWKDTVTGTSEQDIDVGDTISAMP